MNLEEKINADIKACMLSKEKEKLEALRAIKSAILLEKTAKGNASEILSEETELKLLQKLVKQRRESAEIYHQKNRVELEAEEKFQAKVIEQYLPKQMSTEELQAEISNIITQTGASGMKDMGKVMGMVSKQFAGKADNKLVSEIVKMLLSA